MALRDRLLTPVVARAMTSPSGILLAGAGTAVGVLAGLGPVALALGVVAWGVRVAGAVPRAATRELIDPKRVREPWRGFVTDAQQAERRFGDTVRQCQPGPVRDRMQALGGRVADAVDECWRVATNGDRLADAVAALDVPAVERELEDAHAERERLRGDADGEAALARTEVAIEAQLAAAARLRRVAGDAENRLRLLNAQLDETVARAVEISVRSTDAGAIGVLSAEVEQVVGELEALRSGLEEVTAADASQT